MVEIEPRHVGDTAASRLGQVLIDMHTVLEDVITFEGGCQVMAPMFAALMRVDSLLLTIESLGPVLSIVVVIRRGDHPVLLDSREGDIDFSAFDDFEPEPVWEFSIPQRITMNIRIAPGAVPETVDLDPLAAVLLPFHELVRRSDRLSRATSLLDVALDAVAAQEPASMPRSILRHIGKAVGAVAGYYPAEDGKTPQTIWPQAVAPQTHDVALLTQIFQQFGLLPGGPVQRVFESSLRSAPATLASLTSNDDIDHSVDLLGQLPINDFIAVRVLHQNRSLGVLVVLATTLPGDLPGRTFTSSEVATLRSYALVAGWALTLASEYGQLRRSLQQSEMLRHVAINSFRLRDFSQTVELASTVAKTALGADYVAVALIEENWSSSRWVFAQGNRTQVHHERPMHTMTGSMRDWFKRSSWYVLEDSTKDTRAEPGAHMVHRAEGLVSSISVSFLVPGGGYGFLLLGFRERRQIETADVEFAQSMAQTMTAVLNESGPA